MEATKRKLGAKSGYSTPRFPESKGQIRPLYERRIAGQRIAAKGLPVRMAERSE
jgi:hypothetical protein